MNARTPTPWRYQAEGQIREGRLVVIRYPIYTAEGPFGHPAECNREEDAAFIVEACNAHDSLVAERSALLRLVYDAIVNLDPMDAPNWTGPVYRDVISKVLCDLRGAIVNMPFARAELSKLMGRAAKVGE